VARSLGLTLLVVDGRTSERDGLAGQLSGIPGAPMIGEVYTAADATQALRLLHRIDVDGVFVQVNLPGLDGFDLARVLSQYASPPPVVFVAEDPSRAVEAFEVAAVDFVLRTAEPARFAESLLRLARLTGRDEDAARRRGRPAAPAGAVPKSLVAVDVLNRSSGLPLSEVRWMEARGDYVRLHTAAESHLVNGPLATLVASGAADGFIQTHRSYAVQLNAVSELRRTGKMYTVAVDGRELPVSRRYAHQVKDRLLRSVAPAA
jgi:DNA-binding LytR/AlgR family response regulator